MSSSQSVMRCRTTLADNEFLGGHMRRVAIGKAAVQGMVDAEKAWRAIQGDVEDSDLLSDGGRSRKNEQFFSSFIARRLQREAEDTDYITHETNHFLIETAVRSKKNTAAKSFDYRYDLVIWNKNNQPYCIIEVKIARRWNTVKRDLEKLCEIIEVVGKLSGGTVRNGYIVFLTRGQTAGKIAEIRKNIEIEINNYLRDSKVIRPDQSVQRIDSPIENLGESDEFGATAFRISTNLITGSEA